MTTNHTNWISHTNRDGKPCAQCSTCGANAHPGLVGTDEDCARCVVDALPKEAPMVLPKIDLDRWVRISR
jgi:hypothetical protein